MRTRLALIRTQSALTIVLAAAPSLAADWTNTGGNARRNGLSAVLGPDAATLRWSAPEFSIISWSVVAAENRAFTVKQTGFPTNGGAANDSIVGYNLDTGAFLWRTVLPFGGNTSQDWTAWIAGARDGRLYASRSGNGASVAQRMRALNAATGANLWISQDTVTAGPYDGVVFAPDGDLIVADFRNITRINSTDGLTVWRASRLCSVSGNCGGAATDSAIFIADAVPGGGAIKKYSLATGALLYQSPTISGFTAQNSPFLSADGQTVFFARSQNNQPVDNLFAFRDSGSALTQIWSRPIRWTTSHEHGIGPDGSIYTFIPDTDGVSDRFVRLDPATGAVLNTAPVLSPLRAVNLSPKTAVDRSGIVYLSNGWANVPQTNGRLWAFPPDLSSILFTINLDNPNNGGPAIAADGTLLIADRNGLRAFKSNRCTADFNNDGSVDFFDYLDFVAAFDAQSILADFNGDQSVDFFDYLDFVQAFDAGCP